MLNFFSSSSTYLYIDRHRPLYHLFYHNAHIIAMVQYNSYSFSSNIQIIIMNGNLHAFVLHCTTRRTAVSVISRSNWHIFHHLQIYIHSLPHYCVIIKQFSIHKQDLPNRCTCYDLLNVTVGIRIYHSRNHVQQDNLCLG